MEIDGNQREKSIGIYLINHRLASVAFLAPSMFSAVLTFLRPDGDCILSQSPISRVHPTFDWPIKIFSGHAAMLMTLCTPLISVSGDERDC